MNKNLRGTLEVGIISLYALETDVFMFFLYVMLLNLTPDPVINLLPPFIIGSCISVFAYWVIKIFTHNKHQNFLSILLLITGSVALAYVILFVIAFF